MKKFVPFIMYFMGVSCIPAHAMDFLGSRGPSFLLTAALNPFSRVENPVTQILGGRSWTRDDLLHVQEGLGLVAEPDVFKEDAHGRTALHYAILQGTPQQVADLIQRNAQVNHRDHDGNTPLHVAANLNCNTIVKLLLEHGADMFIINNFNQIPLDIAVHHAKQTLEEQLREYKETRKNTILAVIQGLHPRLGNNSPVQYISLENIKYIADLLPVEEFAPIGGPRRSARQRQAPGIGTIITNFLANHTVQAGAAIIPLAGFVAWRLLRK